MQKISAWTDLATPAGAYRYGSLVGGVAPTPLKAEWLNMVQDELCNFILAYLPALNKDDNAQMLKAAQKMVANFALKATTLAGYGILDAYTKAQTDYLLSQKANWAITLGGYGITDAYTKTEIDAAKANKATTLGGYGIADAYTNAEVDAGLNTKADKATSLAGYNIADPIWTDLNATAKAIVAQASAEVGAVGTYALLVVGGGVSSGSDPLPAGTLIAGGYCTYANAAASSPSGIPAGTWKLMGAVYNHDGQSSDSTTLCLRVS
ncbi:hypothetical protein H4C80_00290 [Pseudomonas juntendi]|uniref:Tail fiber protein n=1 Tax=Pseudomonas juntendi TaxID=2666183 RepID=A0A7W2KC28_9PSED|nr:hypothetical protein [Pseudomonas juntendi]MBA6095587.1 hypothetical protein [Pseudomonas juntendi]